MILLSKIFANKKGADLTPSTRVRWDLDVIHSGADSTSYQTHVKAGAIGPGSRQLRQSYFGSIGFSASILLAVFLLTVSNKVEAGFIMNIPNDSIKVATLSKVTTSLTKIPVTVKNELYRTFEGLHLEENSLAPVDPILIPNLPLADSILEKRNHAHSLLEKVMSGQRFLETLDALSEIELPIGIVKPGGILDYSILIDRINFTSQGAVMEVYVSLALPQSGDRIAFNGKIPLSKEGGIAGTAKVMLLGDHAIQLSNSSLLTIKGSNNTYVEFDCNGFKGISIEAEVQFSRDLIVPEDDKGNVTVNSDRVKVTFTTYAQSLNDLMVGITIPPFQVKGLKGVGFKVNQAFLDWSDLANPPGLSFPASYTSPFKQTGNEMLWQGFYLQRLEVRLPASFAKRQNDQRVTMGVEKMILDDQGFNGDVFAEHVIESGDMSGWAYTLDRLKLGLVTNQITAFEIVGKLTIPIVKTADGKNSQFGYIAQRGADGNYIFAVSVQSKLNLPLLIADVNLFPGSSVTVRENNNRFFPTANLNGELGIKGTGKGVKANFTKIHFEGLRISTEEPHLDIQSLGYGGAEPNSVSKFPVVIRNIELKKDGHDRLGLGFDLNINIGGKPEDEGFSGTAMLMVWAKHEMQDIKDAEGQVIGSTRDNWKFDKVELGGVGIKIKKPQVYDLAGTINFFDGDPIYGDGFKGTAKGSLSKFGGIEAMMLFGQTPTFRYWYADGLIKLNTGVILVPGALFATGFGGGFYLNMKQSPQAPASSIGETKSGVYYLPDENTNGIKAFMTIGTVRPEAMNGDVGLEVVINRHGGINSVTLTGNANFMSLQQLAESKMKELASSAAAGKLAEKLAGMLKGQVFGNMKLMFDNENDVFHGNLEIYVNVAGGIVRGISDGNKAGWAVLHFEQHDWYVLIGTPDQPIGLEVARIFKAESYFMLGKHLPGSPPPPSQVTEILGNVNLDYMRDFNALESGLSFAFGLHFVVDTGDLRFLMFYGRFAAGTGVDFMLKDYGTQYHCEGSSAAMGINGWYANGQAYAFVTGKIGIKVNLKFYKGNYDIISLGAAAILQTKGPNPFWMKGIVGGYYRILGGLVKGQCKFEVTVGKDCKPVGEQSVLGDVKMIAEISPTNNSNNIDVFNAPQVAFNVPVGEIFEITDEQNRIHFFRATLDEFAVLDGTQQINGALQWNADNNVVIFDGDDILPGEKKLKAKARLSFEEKINGHWNKVKFQGKIVEEIAETNFETAKAPDYIPANNVALSYPLAGQVNFYPKEYNQGFIQLKDGQPYLFNPEKEWVQKIRMTDAISQRYLESDFIYNQSERKVKFTIPTGFENAKVYHFEILNIPKQNTVIDANVQNVQTELNSEDAGSATLTTKKIEGQLDRLEVKSLYSSNFRSSKYNTFTEKMKAITLDQAMRETIGVSIFQIDAYIIGDELFDAAEVSGTTNCKQLINMEAILDGNAWYQNYAYPIIYEGYPLLGWMKVGRVNPERLGIPPVRDMYFDNFTQKLSLSENAVDFTPLPFTREFVAYNVGESAAYDFYDMRRHAVNYVVDNPSLNTRRLEKLILQPLPRIRYGAYRFRINYVIPGTDKANSYYEWEVFNRIPDYDN
jgi:hypothetical protein